MVIGIYDSGLGGLSVWRELREKVNVPLVYFGDTANVPYGEKTPDQLRDYFMASLAFLESRGCERIVVACNTTSAVVLPQVKGELRFPVIGMIESAVEAVAQATKGRVGVLATRATTESGVYQRALSEALPSGKVFVQSAPHLVPLVEQGEIHGDSVLRTVQEYMAPLLAEEIDTLLLGCTHYSFLSDVIKEVAGKQILVIDPAPTVSKQACKWLVGQRDSISTSTQTEFWVSAHPEKFKDKAELVLGEKLSVVDLHPMWGERI
ncbi:MAG: glutamate racemase [Firmicutes bacterium]|nr:glutamate racemase [Bacillota bacterium]